MKNEQLIKKILNKIHNKSYHLLKTITIDDEELTDITFTETHNDPYKWTLTNDSWEVPLLSLTNRELTKLYQSL